LRQDPPLLLSEIFYSLQGESLSQGLPTVFVRLSGCPLRCRYCDTRYAFSDGTPAPLGRVYQQVAAYGVRHVTVTGGEPLFQPAVFPLLRQLCEENFFVSLETNGALDIAPVDSRVTIVMDIKTPGSRESHQNRLENLNLLKSSDVIKFVICDREDYLWSLKIIQDRELLSRFSVIFLPAVPLLSPVLLADWLLVARLPIRLQLQMHKLLWGNTPGR
jgi:7-carboxy-7-deazaguanine synthase